MQEHRGHGGGLSRHARIGVDIARPAQGAIGLALQLDIGADLPPRPLAARFFSQKSNPVESKFS
jgi:hypothetical protein